MIGNEFFKNTTTTTTTKNSLGTTVELCSLRVCVCVWMLLIEISPVVIDYFFLKLTRIHPK